MTRAISRFTPTTECLESSYVPICFLKIHYKNEIFKITNSHGVYTFMHIINKLKIGDYVDIFSRHVQKCLPYLPAKFLRKSAKRITTSIHLVWSDVSYEQLSNFWTFYCRYMYLRGKYISTEHRVINQIMKAIQFKISFFSPCFISYFFCDIKKNDFLNTFIQILAIYMLECCIDIQNLVI